MLRILEMTHADLEAFFKSNLLQVHPQTILSAHRHTGFTVIEPCRV